MKKLLGVMVLVLLFSVPCFAADTMVFTASGDGTIVRITGVCTAKSDGTFTSRSIEATDVGFSYWVGGYYLLDAWVVNSATNDHTNAAVVTITDDTGRQVIGATAGDTLSLSQAASGVAYMSASRSAGQRAVTGKLTVAIADTGSTATVQTLYLILGK